MFSQTVASPCLPNARDAPPKRVDAAGRGVLPDVFDVFKDARGEIAQVLRSSQPGGDHQGTNARRGWVRDRGMRPAGAFAGGRLWNTSTHFLRLRMLSLKVSCMAEGYLLAISQLGSADVPDSYHVTSSLRYHRNWASKPFFALTRPWHGLKTPRPDCRPRPRADPGLLHICAGGLVDRKPFDAPAGRIIGSISGYGMSPRFRSLPLKLLSA